MLKQQTFEGKLKRDFLAADVFSSIKENPIKDLWEKSKNIEITLDFLKFFDIFKKYKLLVLKRLQQKVQRALGKQKFHSSSGNFG